jgi:hypothetical protein
MNYKTRHVCLLLFIIIVIGVFSNNIKEGMSSMRNGSSNNGSSNNGSNNNGSTSSNTDYYPTSSVSSSQIPSGDEDLYILKSSIVPPVCPACPSCPPSTNDGKPIPACPACARCPEASFDCKKVPNYDSSATANILPQPFLNDFSAF